MMTDEQDRQEVYDALTHDVVFLTEWWSDENKQKLKLTPYARKKIADKLFFESQKFKSIITISGWLPVQTSIVEVFEKKA